MHKLHHLAATLPRAAVRAAGVSLLRSIAVLATRIPASALLLSLVNAPGLAAQTAPVPSFTLAVGSPALALAANTGGTDTVSVRPANGFGGAVSFSATGIPSGVDTAFLPASSASGTTFVVYVPPGTAGGNFPITITGASGSVSASTTFTLVIPVATATNTTICQAQGSASYCSDQTPGAADGNGYHDLPWVNLNKALSSIAVSDNQVWGLDSSGILWFLPNFKTGATWTKVASGVSQISAGHTLLCQINSNRHVYCSSSPNPLTSQPDANGFQSVAWFDTGATNLKQIAVSAGTQFWGIDTNGNLIQVKDYTRLSSTSTMVAAGVSQVAVDGRGTVCQVNSNQYVYCSNWAAPSPALQSGPYAGLPWVQTSAQWNNIVVADGQVWGTDSHGDVWQMSDYTNSATWYRIAYGGGQDILSAASAPSQFSPSDFAAGEVAVLFFMGQSNAVGYNTLPSRFISLASPNVWGVTNQGWNFLPGNENGTTPFNGIVSTIDSVQWSNFALSASGPDMNLGFNNNAGPGGDAANFAAYQWQGLVNAGWPLPDLYIVHIAWPSQGVDAADTTTASAAWTTHGVNLWQPGLTASQEPSYALAPFARQITYRALQSILASGKTPRVLGLQWNQWEAEAGNANPVSIEDAPNNYTHLIDGFYAAAGTSYPVQFVKPLSTAYGATALSQMQTVFANLAANHPATMSVIDVSQVSSTIFSGGVLGGGDGSVHYNLDTHQWFARQAIGTCLQQGSCGTRIASLPNSAPN